MFTVLPVVDWSDTTIVAVSGFRVPLPNVWVWFHTVAVPPTSQTPLPMETVSIVEMVMAPATAMTLKVEALKLPWDTVKVPVLKNKLLTAA